MRHKLCYIIKDLQPLSLRITQIRSAIIVPYSAEGMTCSGAVASLGPQPLPHARSDTYTATKPVKHLKNDHKSVIKN